MAKKQSKTEIVNLQNEVELVQKRVANFNLSKINELMQSLPSFAQDNDENEWKILNNENREGNYSEQDIESMQSTALKLYYVNPQASGLIETMVNFIIGKTATITPDATEGNKDIEKVKKFWTAFTEINKWERRSRELVRRALRDGESFSRLFRPALQDLSDNTFENKVPLMRFVEPSEIKSDDHTYGIEVDSHDCEKIINYYREFNVKKNGASISEKETIPADEIVHTKIRVDSNVKRGISFFVGIAKYIVKYDSWLSDRIVLNKIRTLFNVIMKVQGITPSDFKAKFADKTATPSATTDPSKKLPKAGSVLVANPTVDYEMMNLNIRAQDTRDDGRNIELMIAKGTSLTEYVVRGDASNSNYSSTMVSESPMVRMFESWQDLFMDEFKEIYKRVIKIGKDIGAVSKNASEKCEVSFPGLIHRDIESETKALVIQRDAGFCSTKTASETLGHNYEEEKETIKKEMDDEYLNDMKRQNEEHNHEEDDNDRDE